MISRYRATASSTPRSSGSSQRAGEGNPEHKIARSLIHHQREARTGDEELEEGVTRRQRRRLDLAGVPRAHDHAAARRLLADETDRLTQLVDVPPVGRDPIAPLLAVVASSVPRKASTPAPVLGERIAIPDVHPERVQLVDVRASGEEPEELRDDRSERKTFCGD